MGGRGKGRTVVFGLSLLVFVTINNAVGVSRFAGLLFAPGL